MVKVINKSVCRGVAGKRVGNVKGVVIHNDAGAVGATAESYVKRLESMTNKQLENGFAHYYIDRNTVARVEDTYNKAWHTANQDGNAYYIGYEVCQSLCESDKDFLANEQATFKQVAEDLQFYGLKASRDTVRLHREFVATACPHRSWDLHGKSINSVKDYFIAQINKYMGVTTPKPPAAIKPPAKPKPPVKPQDIKRVAEKGTFYPNTTVAIKHTPTIKAKQEATLGKGESVIYDSYVKSDGYVWVSYIRNNGKRGYACSRDVKTGKAFGTFK
ncbi:SH3 domain-containing protein [Brochothrix thermosphacta]|uniref:SH3 domain-containing protein n=1 Tax=Brochothrix thermosphacta TaxID=2756 RepID=UPI0039AFFB13